LDRYYGDEFIPTERTRENMAEERKLGDGSED
jgi:hypothetical protein